MSSRKRAFAGETEPETRRLTQVLIHLERLTHNWRLLQQQANGAAIWPVLKANAYGHDAAIVGAHLMKLGCRTLCVADVGEAAALIDTGLRAKFIVLSAALPEHAEALVRYDCEPVVCTLEMAEALAAAAKKAGKRLAVHVKVDTGMGRLGVPPDLLVSFLDRCRALSPLKIRGLMSHFPRADEADLDYSRSQLACFKEATRATQNHGIEARHMANSAAIFQLPESHFDAVRPGIALYGLRPAPGMTQPAVLDLKPALEWQSRVIFLKEVPADAGLSYGHEFHTDRPSLIATVPIGYGDGLPRALSNDLQVLIRGTRCPQVGRITMDMSLIDVTALRGRVDLGDEVVVIGRQGADEITADELAAKLGTINYEVVTAISHRVPRVPV